MPARSKVQNVDEARRWIEEGKDYSWIVEKYREKYNIETTPGYWATFRHRQGLERRLTRNTDLIPWAVKEEHRWNYNLVMLRFEARLREGKSLQPRDASRLESWKKWLQEENLVIYYDADTEDGFFAVPREPQDKDLIREPKPSQRRSEAKED
jgi:hypothetical protein